MADEKEWVQKLIDECTNTGVDEEGESEISDLDAFKAVTENLVTDALKTLEEMEGLCEVCGELPELMEKYHLLYHYLDYLKRFCEGEV